MTCLVIDFGSVQLSRRKLLKVLREAVIVRRLWWTRCFDRIDVLEDSFFDEE